MDSFDTQGVTDDSALSPLELEAFYTKLKIIIWVIRVEVSFDTHPTEVSYATGFSTDSRGLVLTCSHTFAKHKKSCRTKIFMRRLDDNDFSEAELFYQRPKWDLALLRVNIVGDWCSGKLATDGSILAGQTLFHIGHPSRFVGSFLTGRAAYRCLDVVVPSRAQTCGQYTSNALHHTPRNRVMGDVWNSEYFSQFGPNDRKYSYEKNLDPLVPIIQITSLICREGCSGGPLFNDRGEIVGMVVLGLDGYDIAIHVAMLEHFMKEMENTRRDVILDDDKIGCSKRQKGEQHGYD